MTGTVLEDTFPMSSEAHDVFSWDVAALRTFLRETMQTGRHLAVITSGGTAVALELNAVRYLENFSTGSRGAACAEELLLDREDYSVLFFYRGDSKLPFSRHLREPADESAANFALVPLANACELRDPRAVSSLSNLRHVQSGRRLHYIKYTTVEEYLFGLRKIALEVEVAKVRTMFVLAAAVSDFYIPHHRMSEHKLQSSEDGLTLRLQNVPKCLGLLTTQWAPSAFVVSFKLETQESLLMKKCEEALQKYSVHAVVGNLLQTRYDTVHVVSRLDPAAGTLSTKAVEKDVRHCIEYRLMKALAGAHEMHMLDSREA